MDFTILTTNIVNYVGLCEQLPADNIVKILNENYFGIIHPTLNKFDGELENIIGDRQTAYWRNSKKNNGSFLACSSALEILKNIKIDQETLSSENRFKVNIAITSGQATEVENILFGDIVNLNSQLLSICQRHKVPILIDENTHLMLNGELSSREIDSVYLNERDLVKLYELF